MTLQSGKVMLRRNNHIVLLFKWHKEKKIENKFCGENNKIQRKFYIWMSPKKWRVQKSDIVLALESDIKKEEKKRILKQVCDKGNKAQECFHVWIFLVKKEVNSTKK